MTDEATKLPLESADIVKENVAKLECLFPEIMEDGKIDFDKLREILGDSVDDGQERYAFTWPGKRDAIRLSQTPSAATLRPRKDKSVDWDTTKNLYIEGDNLEVLKLLQRSYHGKVKMIYIDPPYNTGNDFVYNDSFSDPIENYKRQTGQGSSANPETAGRYHSNWCNMMYPRLRLARELLSDDGVIFISIDDHEIINARNLLNELFGENTFVACISVLNNPRGRNQDKYIATCSEYLLIYSKSELPANSVSIPKSAEDIEKDYPERENGKYYRLLELRNTHRTFGKFNRPNLYYAFYVNTDGKISLTEQAFSVAVYPNWADGFEGCWTWGKEKALKELDDLVAKKVDGVWKIYRKAWATDSEGNNALKQLKSIWIDNAFTTDKGQLAFNNLFNTKEKIFQSPKSVDYIKQCILMSQENDGDIVLDFFSGSATTAHAVMKLNSEDNLSRRFIMAQLPEVCATDSEAAKAGYRTICELGEERIRRAGQKIKAEVNESNRQLELGSEPKSVPDIGFRVLSLDSSNIEEFHPSDGLLLQDSMVKGDRSKEDVLFEVMLKWGLDLSLPIESLELDGYKCWSVAKGELICCMDDGLTVPVLERIASLEERPRRVLILDSILDDTLKLNAEAIFDRASADGDEIELRTV